MAWSPERWSLIKSIRLISNLKREVSEEYDSTKNRVDKIRIWDGFQKLCRIEWHLERWNYDLIRREREN